MRENPSARQSILCLLALTFLFATPAKSWADPLTLSFDSTGVSVSGATASGEVAWVGLAREPMQYFQKVTELRQVSTADAAGTASLALAGSAPYSSLWIAIDVTSGAFAVGTPEDYPMLAEPLGGANLVLGAQDKPIGLHLAQLTAQVLVVRPGTGAWSLKVVDGTAEDADGEFNSALEVALPDLEPLGSAAAPAELEAGDVVAWIDPDRFTHTVATLQAGTLAQEGN